MDTGPAGGARISEHEDVSGSIWHRHAAQPMRSDQATFLAKRDGVAVTTPSVVTS